MTDEAAKELADAMNRLATAIESVRGQGLVGGIQVYHLGLPTTQPWPWYPAQTPYPYYPTWGGSCLSGNAQQTTTGVVTYGPDH